MSSAVQQLLRVCIRETPIERARNASVKSCYARELSGHDVNPPAGGEGAAGDDDHLQDLRHCALAEAERFGAFRGAPLDLRDGFIHFSTAAQAAETAAKHFAGAADLVLVAVDADALGAGLKWEPSRGGALFPHLYGDSAARRGAVDEAAAARRRRPPRLPGACAVIGLLEAWARPLLRLLDPEDAHRLADPGA